MSKNFYILKVLEYYDVPQVFLATDRVTKYISLLFRMDEKLEYISVAISERRLVDYFSKKVDLRFLFEQPEVREWYILNEFDENSFMGQYQVFSEVPEEFLPYPDCFWEGEVVEDIPIIQEVIKKNNPIVALKIGDSSYHKVPALLLADTISFFQNIVKYTCKKVMAATPRVNRNLIDANTWQLGAYANAYGSYSIHFEMNVYKNIFGESIVDDFFPLIDRIFTDFNNEENYLMDLREIKGHTLSNFKKILNKISENNIVVSYQWASPATTIVSEKRIDRVFADKVISILNRTSELTQEIKEFEGVITQLNESGSWSIHNESDDKKYTGTASPEQLRGVIFNSTKYKIICEEKVEINSVTGKENFTYAIMSMQQL